MTGNDGILWKPVFRAAYEKEPPTDTIVSAAEEKKISVFGCTFEPGEYNTFPLESEVATQNVAVNVNTELDLDPGLAVNMDIFDHALEIGNR